MGFAGVFSTMMATLAAYGGLVYVGAAFTNFNYGAIFVLIGVGECQYELQKKDFVFRLNVK